MVTAETREVEAYAKHKNLKLAADELGMRWQTLYVHLRNSGVPVTGDKARYGCAADRLAVFGESIFQQMVPYAIPENETRFQAKYDFTCAGHKVDVKTSMPRQLNKRFAAKSWSFSLKKQALICDFICCLCLNEEKAVAMVLLVPKEFFVGKQTVSVPCNGVSKWKEYAVLSHELAAVFTDMKHNG